MFYTSSETIVALRPIDCVDTYLPDPGLLRRHCLEPAELWVLKRRANRPYRAPQRLPQVAPVS